MRTGVFQDDAIVWLDDAEIDGFAELGFGRCVSNSADIEIADAEGRGVLFDEVVGGRPDGADCKEGVGYRHLVENSLHAVTAGNAVTDQVDGQATAAGDREARMEEDKQNYN